MNLDPLNESGVSGKAVLILKGDTLKVKIHASGLEPNMEHLQHIHGLESSNATCPPTSAAGKDDVLTIGEGLPFYRPVLQPLTRSSLPRMARSTTTRHSR